MNALKTVAEREPSNATPRVQLGNLYFDAERYDDAIKWYGEALKLAPKTSTSAPISASPTTTRTSRTRRSTQFDHSLKLDPKHAKTLLNVGIVKAFGKQDLDGAEAAWQQVVAIAPDSPEGQAAKRALDSLQSAHAGVGARSRVPDAAAPRRCSSSWSSSSRARSGGSSTASSKACAAAAARPRPGADARRADGARSGVRHLRPARARA